MDIAFRMDDGEEVDVDKLANRLQEVSEFAQWSTDGKQNDELLSASHWATTDVSLRSIKYSSWNVKDSRPKTMIWHNARGRPA